MSFFCIEPLRDQIPAPAHRSSFDSELSAKATMSIFRSEDLNRSPIWQNPRAHGMHSRYRAVTVYPQEIALEYKLGLSRA